MPVGLPKVSSTPEQCRLLAARAADAWRDFLVYLDLSSTAVYWNSCRTAYNDVRVATSSVGALAYLTLKPIVLIIWLVLQYLWKLLQFLSKQLFYHAYESAKKGWTQLKWGTKEFVKWQGSLSKKAAAVEICIMAALIGCYMLRRYIAKRKYVQRVNSWSRRKKRLVKEVSVAEIYVMFEDEILSLSPVPVASMMLPLLSSLSGFWA